MESSAKYIRSEGEIHFFQVGKNTLRVSNTDLEKSNLKPTSLQNPGSFYFDYKKDKKGQLKVNNIRKDIFGHADENFAIRFYRSPIYKNLIEPKSQLIKEITRPKFDGEIIKKIILRQLIHSQAACIELPKYLELNTESLDEDIKEFRKKHQGFATYSTDWRLISGLGGSSMFETGMTLHHIYGFPYLPASSVKGIVRSWLIQEYFGNPESANVPAEEKEWPLKNAEYRAYQNLGFCYLFGTTKEVNYKKGKEENTKSETRLTALARKFKDEEKQFEGHIGNIVFFDALPTTPPKIEADIMNPHYPKYYNGDQPPADWQNPTPIFFLTVKDTTFQFLFGIRRGISKSELDFLKEDKIWFKHPEDTNMNKKGNAMTAIKDLLEEALKYHGIGAKTSVGYGLMTKAE